MDNVLKILLPLLPIILGSDQLQDAVAKPAADALADVLPDVAEDHIATFLEKIAANLRAVNP